MKLTDDQLKSRLIEAGVKNLHEFGYPECNSDTILTDAVYKAFFKSMLEDNIGKSVKQVDAVINNLLQKLKLTTP